MKALGLWSGEASGLRVAARIGSSRIGLSARALGRFRRSAPLTDSPLSSSVLRSPIPLAISRFRSRPVPSFVPSPVRTLARDLEGVSR